MKNRASHYSMLLLSVALLFLFETTSYAFDDTADRLRERANTLEGQCRERSCDGVGKASCPELNKIHGECTQHRRNEAAKLAQCELDISNCFANVEILRADATNIDESEREGYESRLEVKKVILPAIEQLFESAGLDAEVNPDPATGGTTGRNFTIEELKSGYPVVLKQEIIDSINTITNEINNEVEKKDLYKAVEKLSASRATLESKLGSAVSVIGSDENKLIEKIDDAIALGEKVIDLEKEIQLINEESAATIARTETIIENIKNFARSSGDKGPWGNVFSVEAINNAIHTEISNVIPKGVDISIGPLISAAGGDVSFPKVDELDPSKIGTAADTLDYLTKRDPTNSPEVKKLGKHYKKVFDKEIGEPLAEFEQDVHRESARIFTGAAHKPTLKNLRENIVGQVISKYEEAITVIENLSDSLDDSSLEEKIDLVLSRPGADLTPEKLAFLGLIKPMAKTIVAENGDSVTFEIETELYSLQLQAGQVHDVDSSTEYGDPKKGIISDIVFGNSNAITGKTNTNVNTNAVYDSNGNFVGTDGDDDGDGGSNNAGSNSGSGSGSGASGSGSSEDLLTQRLISKISSSEVVVGRYAVNVFKLLDPILDTGYSDDFDKVYGRYVKAINLLQQKLNERSLEISDTLENIDLDSQTILAQEALGAAKTCFDLSEEFANAGDIPNRNLFLIMSYYFGQGKYSRFDLDGYLDGASLAADIAPVIGTAKGFYELGTGVNPLTAENLTPSERAISAISGLIGMVGGGGLAVILKGGKKLPGGSGVVDAFKEGLEKGAKANAVEVFDATKSAGKQYQSILESAKKHGIPSSDIKRVVNQSNHVFGPKSLEKHKLGDFLNKHDGDPLGAFKSLENAAQTKANSGTISDVFETTVTVKDTTVTVRGRVIEGSVKLSTAFIP